jgi:cellulose synthase/poly-beta-1,6-N-acetylglucosamine synthase-like glycosyltransferase
MPASQISSPDHNVKDAIGAPVRPTVSVIVGSYKRADSLSSCIDALTKQSLHPDEVIVVAREDDLETLAVCARVSQQFDGFRAVRVTRPGQVAALNAGLRAARGEVIAFTDDDAQPEPDWLEQVMTIFAAEPGIGAIGGPDIIDGSNRPPARRGQVGRISWYGRMSGNHDIGTMREDVDILKGVNMSFRTAALVGFDERLRGQGAQVGNDMKVSLSARRRGYRVVYDPRVRVRHYPARRPDGPRNHRSLKLLRDQHYNETYIHLTTLPFGRAVVCTAYAALIGYRSAPGFAHMVLKLIAGPERVRAVAEFTAVGFGRLEGLATAIGTIRHRRDTRLHLDSR